MAQQKPKNTQKLTSHSSAVVAVSPSAVPHHFPQLLPLPSPHPAILVPHRSCPSRQSHRHLLLWANAAPGPNLRDFLAASPSSSVKTVLAVKMLTFWADWVDLVEEGVEAVADVVQQFVSYFLKKKRPAKVYHQTVWSSPSKSA